MILTVQRLVHDAVANAIRRQFSVADVPPFTVEVPPTRALGDLAVTVAFQLARTLRKAPRAIAQELAAAVGPIPGVTRVDVAPNGYLNLSLDRRDYLIRRVRNARSDSFVTSSRARSYAARASSTRPSRRSRSARAAW